MPLLRPAAPTALLLILGALAPAAATAASPGDRLQRALGPRATVSEHRETGRVRFVGTDPGRPLPRPAGVPASAPAADVARAFLARNGAAFGARAGELSVASSHRQGGRTAVRFQQRISGVPVLGGELVVNLDAGGRVLSAGGEALPGADVPSPAVGSAEARESAIDAVAREHGVPASSLDASMPELWLYDAKLLGGPGPDGTTLVWRTAVTGRRDRPADADRRGAGQRRPLDRPDRARQEPRRLRPGRRRVGQLLVRAEPHARALGGSGGDRQRRRRPRLRVRR